MDRIPLRLARAIRAMPSDQPGPIIETIEAAGFAIVPLRDLVELRRAWGAFLDGDVRLGAAVMKVRR